MPEPTARSQRTPIVRLFWKLHPWLYRVSSGRILGELAGMKVLLLTTTGARSGVARTTALTFITPEGSDDYVVVGSFVGEPRHPGWVHNMRAKPEARVQLGAKRFRARAREAQGEERAQLWKQIIAVNEDYARYEGSTDREIPLVVLSPIA